jgi:DNA polymerase-3 subunit beta
MRFSVNSTDLLKQLQIVSGAVASNPVLPILEFFLFKIEKNELSITGTDLETTITTRTEVTADADGSIAMPAKILLDTLKALPQHPVTFNVNTDNNAIEIISSYGHYRLAGENGNEYPEPPVMDSVDNLAVPASILHKGINKTIFATSNDELRPAMTGVFCQVDFNQVTFVSTDAHKLVQYSFTGIESDVSTAFIIPKKSLHLLKNAMPSGSSIVNISFNKANAFFSFDKINIISRLLDTRYPDYNAVIPTDNPFVCTLVREDLLNSLKRIVIYSNKTTNQVILNIKEGNIAVSAQDLDFSNEASEKLPCQYNGEPLTIGFNAKFLIEMLAVLEQEEVKMELSTPSRAGILRPLDQEAGEDIMMLLMPIMLSN